MCFLSILPFTAKAESWGATTNGLQLGTAIFPSWNINQQSDLLCSIDIRNVSTNRRSIYIHRAPNEIRYEMKLLDPQGKPVEAISDKLLELGSNFQHGGTVVTNESSAHLVSFFIVDFFKLQTNGLHTLIVSERFTTNQALIFHPNQKFDYFLMPPVTNTFMVSTNDIPKK